MYLVFGIIILAISAWRIARELLWQEAISEERDWAGNMFRAGSSWQVMVEIVCAVVGLILIILYFTGVLR